jgi:hypothetical protein
MEFNSGFKGLSTFMMSTEELLLHFNRRTAASFQQKNFCFISTEELLLHFNRRTAALFQQKNCCFISTEELLLHFNRRTAASFQKSHSVNPNRIPHSAPITNIRRL